ncbi:MAG: hypothetical protein M1819_000140 [Sarea resinae]|nr:MAG: hypothetical protein M1819_000140 [Sarea resinae]
MAFSTPIIDALRRTYYSTGLSASDTDRLSPHRPARHLSELGPATTRAALNQAYPATPQGPYRRNSTQQYSVSSVQNPRVTEIIQGTGHNTSSTSFRRSSSSGQKPSFYASSAPSSSSALQQQQYSTRRPQVPLFSDSTGTVNRSAQRPRNSMDLNAMSSGKSPQFVNLELSTLNVDSTDMSNLFDLSADFGGDLAPESQVMEHDFSHSTSGNDSMGSFSSNPATVSPKDLLRDPLASAPPSTAFTNLTSPSMFDSPDFVDSFETSPLYPTGDADLFPPQDNWYPLFDAITAEGDASPADAPEAFDSPALTNINTSGPRRKSSSPGQSSPMARSHSKHSSISGVGASKRNRPLPPVSYNPDDIVSVKRARNTEAARKSRQRRVQRLEELEKQVEELQGQVEHWKGIAMAQGGTV